MEYFLKSALIGGIEVLMTHPLEYMKTMYQAFDNTRKVRFHFNSFLQSLYPRLYTVIPMRTVFWSSLNYHKKNNYSALYNAIITSKLQTLIDFPSEQIKTRKMINPYITIYACFRGKYITRGYLCNYIRNNIFLYNYLTFTSKRQDLTQTLLGTLSGIILSQPFDIMKTKYQNNQPVIFDKILLRQLHNGLMFRCTISATGMVIGTLSSQWLC